MQLSALGKYIKAVSTEGDKHTVHGVCATSMLVWDQTKIMEQNFVKVYCLIHLWLMLPP